MKNQDYGAVDLRTHENSVEESSSSISSDIKEPVSIQDAAMENAELKEDSRPEASTVSFGGESQTSVSPTDKHYSCGIYLIRSAIDIKTFEHIQPDEHSGLLDPYVYAKIECQTPLMHTRTH